MIEINNTTKHRVDRKKIETLVAKFLVVYKQTGREISLAVVGDARMRRLNREYRGTDKATDVLSFPAERMVRRARPGRPSKKSGQYLGEIIINIQEAHRRTKYRDMLEELPDSVPASADYIFYFLIIHGLLHLVGYDDATEKGRREMLRRGWELLDKTLKCYN